MSMPTSPTRLLTCEACGATLPFEPEHAGQRCRCGGCGKILVVPGEDYGPKQETAPEYVSFACRVCQTTLSARVEHVGRKAKCPDCYSRTVVPPPTKVKKKQPPQAMHGQQYGLWDVDTAPLPAELAAKQPKFFPVYCRLCQTLMHAQPKQVGSKLTCPDCGVKTLVVEPPPEKPKASALVPDGEEYQLDETSAPSPRPAPTPPEAVEGQKIVEYRDQLQKEYGERPRLPRLPTLQGIFPMLLRSPIPAWWLGLSCALTAAVMLGLEAGSSMGGGFAAIMGVCFLAMACILGILTLSALTTLWCGILTDSSEGNQRLYNPPSPAPQEWFGALLYVGIALAVSLFPAWVLAAIVPNRIAVIGISLLLCFPVVLLSTLEQGSPMEILSPRLLKSLIQRAPLWLLFYLQTAILVGASAWVTVQWLPNSLMAIIPFSVAVSLLYFRLLGRFAWWLAESMPVEDDVDSN